MKLNLTHKQLKYWLWCRYGKISKWIDKLMLERFESMKLSERPFKHTKSVTSSQKG